MTPGDGAPLLRLGRADNVYVATMSLQAGEVVEVDGVTVHVRDRVELGHKIAAEAIAAGRKVVRGGMAIGSATAAIEPGSWVHTHNLRSDYIATVEHRGGSATVPPEARP